MKKDQPSKINFVLEGVMPSKKNAWHRSDHGMYIDHDLKSDLDDFLYQLAKIRVPRKLAEPMAGALEITVRFYVQKVKCDLDNAFTTLLDLLQKSQIIKNDKLVVKMSAERIVNSEAPKVSVKIESEAL